MKVNFRVPIFSAFVLMLVPMRAAEPQLTIYNQNFAVVRMMIPLDLKAGINRVQFTDTTMYLEPDSVMLRDPTQQRTLQIREQNYRADPVTENLLLSMNVGKTLEFLVQRGDKTEIVRGTIIRSARGLAPSRPAGYGNVLVRVPGMPSNGGETIVEIDGKLRFGLPGTPLFPELADDTILKPVLNWILETDRPGRLTAELSYVTAGMNWSADYNMIAPPNGDELEMIGWVTLHNQSGKSFSDARIKLMAGDVNKIQPINGRVEFVTRSGGLGVAGGVPGPQVSEKPFEEYHLYALHRSTTLHNQETKQVEFIRASGIKSERIYVYDGVKVDPNQYRGWNQQTIRQDQDYGTQFNPNVWVMREFRNSQVNHLGMPLPAGRLRFYRQDADGQLEFTGENQIRHTPRDEMVRAFTGSAFDIKGERRRTNYRIDVGTRWLDESFEITLRNHKKEPVDVRVVEHLYRGATWAIIDHSDSFRKTDSQSIEFRVHLAADSTKTVHYTAHYTW